MTRKIFFCDRIRKEMYKVLNLKDKNSYVVFVVKMLIYCIFLSHSKVLELYIYIDDILITMHLTLKLYTVRLQRLFPVLSSLEVLFCEQNIWMIV